MERYMIQISIKAYREDMIGQYLQSGKQIEA